MATILIADDNPINRRLLVTLLGHQGHRLLEAADGIAALELARADRPDLVVSDIVMPRLDGYELARRLRTHPDTQGTSVVFYTAATIEPRMQALAATCGVTRIFPKGSDPEALLRMLNELLSEPGPTEPVAVPAEFDYEHLAVVTDALSEKVDELKAANRELELYRKLLQAAPDAIVAVGRDGHIHVVNRQAEVLFGYDCDELLGRPLEALAPEVVVPVDVAAREAGMSDLRHQAGGGVELTCRRRDGTGFPAEIRLSALKTEDDVMVSAAIRDVTDRKRVEDERLKLEAAPDAMVGVDKQGRIVFVNTQTEALFGYSRAELLGQPVEILAPRAVRDIHPEHRARYFAQPTTRPMGAGLELAGRRKDGTEFPAEISLSAVETDEGVLATAAVRDVSERRRLEQAQREARAAAEAANRSKSEFLSRMSHELRTPLNAVLGFAQLLELAELTDEQREAVAHILKGGRHLLDLINEVLDISRIESGQLFLSPEPVLVSDLLRDVLDLIRPLASGRSASLVADGADRCAHYVLADRQRLKQILLNLLSNAVKYNRPGGTVAVSCGAPSDGWLRINVADTGPGIRPEHLAQLFTPFERLGAEQTDIEGTGIGLTLSRRLAEVMGGTLDVATTLGRGSTFWVELPLVEGPVQRYERLGGGAPTTTQAGLPVGRRYPVLYIEDNLSNLELVQRVLARRHEVEVIPAMQGRLGLELAREHRPALVLLDLHLPDIGGDQVLQCLRDNPATAAIPVIILSADATPGQMQRLISAGATAYLTKPLDVRELLRLLDEALTDTGG